MVAQRRLVLGALTVVSLLCIYVLAGNLQTLSWSVEPLKRLAHGSQWRDLAPSPSPTAPRGHARTTGTPSAHTSSLANCRVSNISGADHVGTTTRTGRPSLLPPRQEDALTADPFIGDAYMSEDVPPQTDCPDAIRSRVPKTEFTKRFLKNIPVLQWSKDATLDEHRRLSRYVGAHGWGGVTFEELAETLAVLNSSANSVMLDDWKRRGPASCCIRCAVVGNGGILKDSKKGKEIDDHHYVFRTNGAIMAGFEEDVGARTTHYTFSTNTLMNSMRSYASLGYRGPPQSQETRYVFLPDHDRDYLLMKAAAVHAPVQRGPERGIDPSRYFGKDVSANKLKMYHPDFIRYLRNRFLPSNTLRSKYKNLYRPSTGAVMLLAALHTCDQVSAYGFMTPDYRRYSDHYYDRSYRPVGFYINHDLRLEMLLWQQLHAAGLIKLYMRS
ncbi:alpha-N-acetylgalactosaminide alpha-2,6-sialyltransferase 2 isoform X2 [Dunckerocampus dactyliophorus]|uniref:alpha-N-acetylgalactosaminide alpha-2,6-sialyltransferase 2 isoform X2 n=1 Tax=Dunckerocampus dactyliophorus TaxID=161453 RepID=UPI002404F183|nr:alpha-N-acetylgalactosaminide alpha-2,6-sialyltransferase 2 isoform X2 [Dunckerocampus dactyliophorus]